MLAAVPHHLIDVREPWQPYSAAEFAADAQRRAGRHCRAWKSTDPGRRHRPVFPGPAGRAGADARSGPRAARGDRRGSRRSRLASPACRTRLGRSARRRQDQAHRSATHPARAGGVPPQRQADQRMAGHAGARAPAVPRAQAGAGAARSCGAAPAHRGSVSTRCSRRASWAKSNACARCRNCRRSNGRWTCRRSARSGYRQAWEYLDGALSENEFRDRAIFATRQLAKRQLTWLRGELDARWFDPQADRQALEAALALFLPAGFGYCVAGQPPVVV